MNWRWLLLDYTDPALPLTRRERRQVWWKAQGLSRGLNHLAMGLRAPRIVRWMHPLIPGVGIFLGHTVQTIWFPSNLAAIILCVPVSFVVMWIGMTYLGKWIWRPHVNQALREMGYDVCGWCGYWLRGLDPSIIKCPECGAKRVQLVKKANPS